MRHESVLITGGTGFLGRGLVGRLIDQGCERIRIYSRGEFAQERMRQELGDDDRVAYFIGDVRDVERLARAMTRTTIVIHAAALKRVEVGHYNPDEMAKTNVLGTMNVIEAARRAGVRRVVFVSSDKAFRPVSPYGFSKALAEELVLAANRMNLGPTFAACRYGNVAGSTGSVIPLWREKLARGAPIEITDPDCTRFWMYREHAIDLVLEAARGGGPLLIPCLKAYRLGDLARALGALDARVVGLPRWEKIHEAMDVDNSSDLAPRMSVAELKEALAHV